MKWENIYAPSFSLHRGSAHKILALLLMDADRSVKGCTSKYGGTFSLDGTWNQSPQLNQINLHGFDLIFNTERTK